MKKLILGLLITAMSVSLFGCTDVSVPEEITVLTYSDYIPLDIISEFKEDTGITINYVTAGDNEKLEAKLNAPSADYDLIIASDYVIHNLVQKNMLQPIDYTQFENNKYVNAGFTGKYYDPESKYTVPYCTAGILIGYDMNKAGIIIDSWGDLLAPELARKVTFLDDKDAIVGIANLICGQEPNSLYDKDSTAKILRSLSASSVLRSNSQTSYPEDALANGKAAAGVLFTSQLGYVTMVNPDIEIVYPKEGYIYSIECMAIPAKSDGVSGAMKFINYVHDPVNNGKIMEDLGVSSTNISGKQFMADDYRDSAGYHIDQSKASEGILFRQLSKENSDTFLSLYNSYFKNRIPKETPPTPAE